MIYFNESHKMLTEIAVDLLLQMFRSKTILIIKLLEISFISRKIISYKINASCRCYQIDTADISKLAF